MSASVGRCRRHRIGRGTVLEGTQTRGSCAPPGHSLRLVRSDHQAGVTNCFSVHPWPPGAFIHSGTWSFAEEMEMLRKPLFAALVCTGLAAATLSTQAAAADPVLGALIG